AKDIFHESVNDGDLKRKLADAAAAITVSDYNARHLRETFGPAAGRLRRVYNGLDLERFTYRSPRERPPLVAAVGRLVEKKGFTHLVEACGLLAEAGCRLRCRIIGAGPLEGGLRSQIADLGLEDRVELLGPRPQRETIRHVREAAAFAAPCVVGSDGNRDGLPTVLLEAMALGTPCVSTDVTGIPEVVRHEETGLMVPQHDPEALATALERLLDDARLRVSLAQRARALIEAEFDVRRNAARLREIFEEAALEATWT
ncbi:MAG: glycosyltransferase family 4 protein, partial [Actinomycetota bacterium]